MALDQDNSVAKQPVSDTGRWVKSTIRFSDYTAAGLTESLTAVVLGAFEYVADLVVHVVTPFSGGAVATATLTLQNKAASASYFAAVDIFTGTSKFAYYRPSGLGTIAMPTFNTGGEEVKALLTTTVANINTLTAGEVWVFIQIKSIPNFWKA